MHDRRNARTHARTHDRKTKRQNIDWKTDTKKTDMRLEKRPGLAWKEYWSKTSLITTWHSLHRHSPLAGDILPRELKDMERETRRETSYELMRHETLVSIYLVFEQHSGSAWLVVRGKHEIKQRRRKKKVPRGYIRCDSLYHILIIMMSLAKILPAKRVFQK